MRPNSAAAWTTIRQPDEDMGYSFETTFRADSKRSIGGSLAETPLFTVESLAYSATDLSVAEMKEILQIVAKGKRFLLHYWSPYYAAWRDASFYVGRGSLVIGQLDKERGLYSSLSMNLVGCDPL